jgi:hypothetical protein
MIFSVAVNLNLEVTNLITLSLAVWLALKR